MKATNNIADKKADMSIKEIKRKDGSTAYKAYVRYSKDASGKRREESKTFDKKAQAVAWLRKTELAKAGGASVSPEKLRLVTFAQMFQEAEQYGLLKNSDLECKTGLLRAFASAELGRINFITVKTAIESLGKLKVSYSPQGGRDVDKPLSLSTQRKYICTFKKVVEIYAARNGYDLPYGTFAKQTLPQAWARPRQFRVPNDVLIKIMKALPLRNHKDYIDFCLFAVASGLRLQEIRVLRFEHLDMKTHQLHLDASLVKNSNPRIVPKSKCIILSKDAVDIIKRRKLDSSKDHDEVFGNMPKNESISQAFQRAAEKAGYKEIMFKDLRHEMMSRLAESRKMTNAELTKLTGHANKAMISEYQVVDANSLTAKKMRKMSFNLPAA